MIHEIRSLSLYNPVGIPPELYNELEDFKSNNSDINKIEFYSIKEQKFIKNDFI
jgi:hypothetical protein